MTPIITTAARFISSTPESSRLVSLDPDWVWASEEDCGISFYLCYNCEQAVGVELSTQDLKRQLYYDAEQRADANLKTLETLKTGKRGQVGSFKATIDFLLPPTACMALVTKIMVLIPSSMPVDQDQAAQFRAVPVNMSCWFVWGLTWSR